MTAILMSVLLFGAPADSFIIPDIGQVAIPNAPATRIYNAEQVTPTDPPPPTVPAELCPQAYYLRAQAGLPARFDRLIWRESNCRNEVVSGTGCCVGLLQLNSIIWRDHRMTDRLADCGATWSNVRGTSLASKVRQMCAAKALYDVDGMSPWSM